MYHNPRGHGIRAGAAVPGYTGFIPGKVANNCFAKRYALENLHATETRKLNEQVGLSKGQKRHVAPRKLGVWGPLHCFQVVLSDVSDRFEVELACAGRGVADKLDSGQRNQQEEAAATALFLA